MKVDLLLFRPLHVCCCSDHYDIVARKDLQAYISADPHAKASPGKAKYHRLSGLTAKGMDNKGCVVPCIYVWYTDRCAQIP